ncbi:hypothetical protein FDP13_05365 [Dickeya sp. ws52]|nr:hypothetical protein FDP13_05365 [Dickeya sp. ws52]
MPVVAWQTVAWKIVAWKTVAWKTVAWRHGRHAEQVMLSGAPGAKTPGQSNDNDYAKSKRSRFITLVQAAMKSWTNFACASVLP